MPKGIIGKVFQQHRTEQHKCFYAFSFLVGIHREPQPINAKLFLPIIPTGVVAYAFVWRFCGTTFVETAVSATIFSGFTSKVVHKAPRKYPRFSVSFHCAFVPAILSFFRYVHNIADTKFQLGLMLGWISWVNTIPDDQNKKYTSSYSLITSQASPNDKFSQMFALRNTSIVIGEYFIHHDWKGKRLKGLVNMRCTKLYANQINSQTNSLIRQKNNLG